MHSAKQEQEEKQTSISEEKQRWIREMRLRFCIRPEFPDTKLMVNDDGTLNQMYYIPAVRSSYECQTKETVTDQDVGTNGISTF
jgi:hypothetical protein